MLRRIGLSCRSKMEGAQKHSAVGLRISSLLGMVETEDLAERYSSITNTTESHDPPCYLDYQKSLSSPAFCSAHWIWRGDVASYEKRRLIFPLPKSSSFTFFTHFTSGVDSRKWLRGERAGEGEVTALQSNVKDKKILFRLGSRGGVCAAKRCEDCSGKSIRWEKV